MEFNTAKCKIMHVGHNNPCYQYTMSGAVLQEVEEEKDVGVTVHRSLKPARHCQKAAGMATGVLKQLAKNFHYRDRYTFRKLYIQYVRPHLEFASPAWSPWSEADKATIEKVQVKAINMISGLQGHTYEEKCRELDLDTLEVRREKQDLYLAHKLIHTENRTYGSVLFKFPGNEGGRQTRAAADPLNMKIPRSRLDVRRHAYGTRIVGHWNVLKPDTKSLSKIGQFKNAVKSHYTGTR